MKKLMISLCSIMFASSIVAGGGSFLNWHTPNSYEREARRRYDPTFADTESNWDSQQNDGRVFITDEERNGRMLGNQGGDSYSRMARPDNMSDGERYGRNWFGHHGWN